MGTALKLLCEEQIRDSTAATVEARFNASGAQAIVQALKRGLVSLEELEGV